MIVNTKLACDSKKAHIYLKQLKENYPFIELISMGKSCFGTELYGVKIGEGEVNSLIVGGHHGLEWMTSLMLLKYIEDFCMCAATGKKLFEYDTAYIKNTRANVFVPMINPDGVDIALGRIPTKRFQEITAMCPYAALSTTWQANGRGVDLNHNYNAGWKRGKAMEKDYGIFKNGPTRYGGEYFESEAETQALIALTRKISPKLALAYHSQGEVIYYKYKDEEPKTAQMMVELFCSVSGYEKDDTKGIAGYRGFKDWFIKEFHRPGFTIEMGLGKNPLPIEDFDEIYKKNIEILLLAGMV